MRIRLNQRNQKQKHIPIDTTNRIPPTNSVIPNKASPTFEPAERVDTQRNIHAIKTAPSVKPAAKPVEIGNKGFKTTTNLLKPAEVANKGFKITHELLKTDSIPKASEKKHNDIHGLIDYIEGNSGNDKAAIAEKKAAKKARQREKKVSYDM